MFRFTLALCLVLSSSFCLFAQDNSPPVLPSQAVEAMSKLVGAWTTNGTRDGSEEFEGYYLARWNESKTGLVCMATEGSSLHYGLAHWDAENERLVENWIGATGLSVVQKYDVSNKDHWTGVAELSLLDGSRGQKKIQVTFGDGKFAYSTDDSLDGPLARSNTKIEESASSSALQSYGKLVAGGTWTNDSADSPARHKYRWQPGNKVLQMTRDEEQFPGIAIVYFEEAFGVTLWKDINTLTGRFSNSIFHETGSGKWRLVDFSFGSDDVSFVLIDLTATGPDKLVGEGVQFIDGEKASEWRREWTRTHE